MWVIIILITAQFKKRMSVQTWVCGRDDGSKKQAVSEEEVSVQLPHLLHQRHAAIHQQPEGGTEHPRKRLRLYCRRGRLNASVTAAYEFCQSPKWYMLTR